MSECNMIQKMKMPLTSNYTWIDLACRLYYVMTLTM